MLRPSENFEDETEISAGEARRKEAPPGSDKINFTTRTVTDANLGLNTATKIEKTPDEDLPALDALEYLNLRNNSIKTLDVLFKNDVFQIIPNTKLFVL